MPRGADPNTLVVFGNKNKDKMHWFLTKNSDDLKYVRMAMGGREGGREEKIGGKERKMEGREGRNEGREDGREGRRE